MTLGLLLPAELLSRAPVFHLWGLPDIGDLLTLVSTVALVAVFLADLQDRPLKSITLSAIIRASLGSLECLFIVYLLLLLLALPAVAAASLAPPSLDRSIDPAARALLVVAGVFPGVVFALLIPVRVGEHGGPIWALKRAWSLSVPRRVQVWLLMGGLWVASVAYGQLSHAPGLAPLAILIFCSLVYAVLEAALVSVFYERLVSEEPPAPVVAAVRSRALAAEGTFRSANGRRARPHRRHR